jgi:hypothetical protein
MSVADDKIVIESAQHPLPDISLCWKSGAGGIDNIDICLFGGRFSASNGCIGSIPDASWFVLGNVVRFKSYAKKLYSAEQFPLGAYLFPAHCMSFAVIAMTADGIFLYHSNNAKLYIATRTDRFHVPYIQLCKIHWHDDMQLEHSFEQEQIFCEPLTK